MKTMIVSSRIIEGFIGIAVILWPHFQIPTGLGLEVIWNGIIAHGCYMKVNSKIPQGINLIIMKTFKFLLNKIRYSDFSIYIFSFVLISIALINSLLLEKHLATDGVHFFICILQGKSIAMVAFTRCFSYWLTQWPVVLAVNLGITNIPFLIKAYALGIYLPWVVSFIICLYALRRQNIDLLIFPLISMIGIYLVSDYILIYEAQVMALLSWPALLLILRLRWTDFTWQDGLLLCLLLFFISCSFEGGILTELIIFIIIIISFFQYSARKNKKEKAILVMALCLSFITVAISVYAIFWPYQLEMKTAFWQQLGIFIRIPTVFLIIAFTCFFSIGLFWKKNIYLWASVIPIIIYSWIILTTSHGILPQDSFDCRTLFTTFMPVLIMLTILFSYYKIKQNRFSKIIFFIFILVFVIGNIRFSQNWRNFRQQFIVDISQGQGYIPMQKSLIKNNICTWYWNNMELSLVWAYPFVRAVILNEPNISWEPEDFDPRKIKVLNKYLNYSDSFLNQSTF